MILCKDKFKDNSKTSDSNFNCSSEKISSKSDIIVVILSKLFSKNKFKYFLIFSILLVIFILSKISSLTDFNSSSICFVILAVNELFFKTFSSK